MQERVLDPLYRNSIYLILTFGLLAASGFIFWVIAARLYPAEDVGLASAVISLGQLITMLSLMGFDMGTIKFLHESDAEELISTSATFVVLVSIFMSIVTISLSNNISKKVSEVLIFPVNLFFVIFVITMALTAIFRQGIFVAIRDTRNSFIQSLASIPRLIVLPILLILKTIGIFIAFSITPMFGLVLGITLIRNKGYQIKFKLKYKLIKKIFLYSLSNYISIILENAPAFILPIMIVNTLGAKMNAYFYIAWAIAALFISIPKSTSMSLFAECSYSDVETKKKMYKSMKFIVLFIVPSIILVYVAGKYLLSFFGKEYTNNSLNLLRILVVAALPYSINTVYAAVCRAKKKMGQVITIFFIISVTTLLLSYISIKKMGLIGIGYSWFIGNCISVIYIVIVSLLKI